MAVGTSGSADQCFMADLRVGDEFPSFKALHSKMLFVNSSQWFVQKRTPSVVRFVCQSRKDATQVPACSFFVYAKLGSNGLPSICTLDLNHNCAREKSGRARGQKSSTYLALESVQNFQTRGPGTQDAAAITRHLKTAHGIGIKYGQASMIAKALHKVDPLSVWSEMERLPAFFRLLKEQDPNGTYCISGTATAEVNQNRFATYYIATGDAKEFWNLSRRIPAVDACHLKTMAGGVWIGAAIKDANNQVRLLAHSHCASETLQSMLKVEGNVTEDELFVLVRLPKTIQS